LYFENKYKEKEVVMGSQLIIWCQETFEELTEWKEQFLRRIFALRWVAPIFRYISPNDLCYLRILVAIVILFLYLRGHYDWMFFIFIIAVIFDFVDGPLARSTNRVTEEGKQLDPVADKVLISIPLLAVGVDRFSGQTVLMFLLIEGLLVLTANYLKPYLREKFSIPLTSGANIFGQIKMSIQAIAVGIILYNPESQILLNIGEVLIWVAIGFGIGSFLRHLARMDEPVEPRKRIITVPNLITLSGLFLIIPAGFALIREEWLKASIILAWIFISDWFDGWVARRFNQITAFGAAIDPIRDYLARFLVISWFFIWIDDILIRTVIAATVAVEVLSGLINVATAKRCKTTSLVNKCGKIKAFVHYVILGVAFFHCIGAYVLSVIAMVVIFSVMFVFSLIALISYVDQRRRLITEQNAQKFFYKK
jgi:CDP-diacylglycerol--glycerol-3-phosphate 3-phosphatidyltransferase